MDVIVVSLKKYILHCIKNSTFYTLTFILSHKLPRIIILIFLHCHPLLSYYWNIIILHRIKKTTTAIILIQGLSCSHKPPRIVTVSLNILHYSPLLYPFRNMYFTAIKSQLPFHNMVVLSLRIWCRKKVFRSLQGSNYGQ